MTKRDQEDNSWEHIPEFIYMLFIEWWLERLF